MSSTPRLIVPRGYANGKPGRRAEGNPFRNPFAQILRRRKSPAQRRYVGPVWKGVGPQPDEHPGRAYGQVVGAWISDLVELRKVIVLCDGCAFRFYYKRAKFYKDALFGPRAIATCDGCRTYTVRGQIFMPEERLIESSGEILSGQCWAPR